MNSEAQCPCGSGDTYRRCCEPAHQGGGRDVESAEALMRSRYSAFVLALDNYLLSSWHVTTRPSRIDPQPSGQQWLGLKILRHEADSADQAIVEFVARSRVAGQRAHRLHEVSRFIREDGRWYYVDGKYPADN